MTLPSVEWKIWQQRMEAHALAFTVVWNSMTEILREEIPRAKLREAIRRGKPEIVLRSIPREIWAPREVSLLKAKSSKFSGGGGFYGSVREMLLEILGDAFNEEVIQLGLPFRFNLRNPFAERWAEEAAAILVREVRQKMIEALREQILRAFREGVAPARAMLEILETGLGLTATQIEAVQNFGVRLETSGQVMIPRWDRMSDAERRTQITMRKKAYYQRKLRERALTIARTETIGAMSEGTRQSWLRARDEGFLDSDAKRTWISSPGSVRTCKICRGLYGAEATLNGPFYSDIIGEVMGPPSHPGCRCKAVLAADFKIEPLSPERLADLNEQARQFRVAAAKARRKRLRNLRYLRSKPYPQRQMRNIPGFEGARAR